jgi:hypothetical protein
MIMPVHTIDTIELMEARSSSRFNVIFPEYLSLNQTLIKKINRPSFTNGKWNDIRIDFYDIMYPKLTEFLFDCIKCRNIYMKDDIMLRPHIELQSLDPIGSIWENISIIVDDFIEINFGDYDKESNETPQPYMIIRPRDVIFIY